MIDSKKTIRTDVPFGQKVFDSKTKRWISPEQVEPPSRLEELEAIIARGKQSYIEVGDALAEVWEKELYKEQNYETFKDYYQQRWGFKKTYVYDLIKASEVALELPEPERPKTERAARKLLNDRRTSAVADKTEPKKPKEIIMDRIRITPEDEAAELLEDIDKRIRANKKNLKFLRALDEWLTESGL